MIVSTARLDELTAILELESHGFDKPQRWSAESWRAELEHPERLVLVGRELDRVIAVACFGVLAETAELLRVIVHPDAQRRGLARKLLGIGKEWAEAAGAERMLLEVLYDNPAALVLYETESFRPIAQRPDYYGTGKHGVVMECQLPRYSLFQPAGWPA